MTQQGSDIWNLPPSFFDVSFNLLMQKRIHKVLLICSNYDAFILEEDGRIDEQLYIEYFSQNLRYSPLLYKTNNAKEALKILSNEKIDLVIEMLNIAEIDTFHLANKIKKQFPNTPIVVLTHFSREVSLKLQYEDLSSVDYVFSWLGNADLLLAIIKLFEDKMNAPFDVEEVGVQCILLVEDSVRYLSSYLPILYKIILQQAREFMEEALNEHQRMLRMRGRPKILVATNYKEALDTYKKYKDNILGVITDVSYKKSPTTRDVKEKLGLQLVDYIRKEDPFIPILLQSSDTSNEVYAKKLNAGFLFKYAEDVSIQLQEYITTAFGFGDFIFCSPDDHSEIARASDLPSLQEKIQEMSDEILTYHANRNEISKWLNARAMFPIAKLFKHLHIKDFPNLDIVRAYINQAISTYRSGKGRRVIAEFERNRYNKYMMFSRIGEGSIGGKARGLAFINNIINNFDLYHKFDKIQISIPRTIVLCTDVFDEYMHSNKLHEVAISSNLEDTEILKNFVKANLPSSLHDDLVKIVELIDKPLAIRSSSKLEDSHYQPFAGVYNTYMVPNMRNDQEKTVRLIEQAIKSVYASVFFKESKAYMIATSNVIDEEKMGIVLQEVCGRQYGNYFYPGISGIAQSLNYYPIDPEEAEDGIVKIALGLGKYIMSGGTSLRFSPKYHKKIIQLSSISTILRDTQKEFFALDLSPDSFIPSTDDEINLKKLKIKDIESNILLNAVTSTYDLNSNSIKEGNYLEGKKVVTFRNILNYDLIPLAEILSELLNLGRDEMNRPVEMEFAVDLDVPNGESQVFSFLQIRPIVEPDDRKKIAFDKYSKEQVLVASDSALGAIAINNINDFVYIDPQDFDASKNNEVAQELERINTILTEHRRSYILAGPGRWGSSDPWLGIPVKWAQISAARVIIEYAMDDYQIEPSQGTHFFHNLISFGVGYITVNELLGEGFIDFNYLNSVKLYQSSGSIKHVRLKKELRVIIDGKSKKGLILKSD